MKKYERPDVEIIRFATQEAIADEAADGETGDTSNPFAPAPFEFKSNLNDDPDRSRS